MNALAPAEGTVRDLLREALVWRVSGLLFRRPFPDRRAEVEALARESGDARLIALVHALAETSEGRYHAWLGPAGRVSPREVSYRPIEDPGRLLAEINAFHAAFAYRAGAEDPPDHVAVAADFVAYLALKEAYARAASRDEEACVTHEARERFLERHVRPMARGMARRLDLAPGIGDGTHLDLAIRALVRLSAADVHGADEEPALGFPRPGLDDEPFGCGTPDGAASGTRACPFAAEGPGRADGRLTDHHAGTPGAGRDRMRPTEILMNEHRVIEQVLDCLDALADACERDGRLDADAAGQTLDFFRTFADRCHHGKEENQLFPLMEARGFSPTAGPTAVMRAEHVQGRALIGSMDEAIPGAARGETGPRSSWLAAARAYSRMLRQHIEKEDHCLFPMAEQALAERDHEELGRQFQRVEHEEMGPGVHGTYLALADALADRCGVRKNRLPSGSGCGCSGGH